MRKNRRERSLKERGTRSRAGRRSFCAAGHRISVAGKGETEIMLTKLNCLGKQSDAGESVLGRRSVPDTRAKARPAGGRRRPFLLKCAVHFVRTPGTTEGPP